MVEISLYSKLGWAGQWGRKGKGFNKMIKDSGSINFLEDSNIDVASKRKRVTKERVERGNNLWVRWRGMVLGKK